MQRRHRIAAVRHLATIFLLGLGVATAAPAAAVRNEDAATRSSAALVAQAASGDIDAAFERARSLGQSGDAALEERLERHKQAAMQGQQTLGAVSSVSTVQESFFAGCVTRSYLVRRVGGTQSWMLKWRRGSGGGWYLQDLAVSGS